MRHSVEEDDGLRLADAEWVTDTLPELVRHSVAVDDWLMLAELLAV